MSTLTFVQNRNVILLHGPGPYLLSEQGSETEKRTNLSVRYGTRVFWDRNRRTSILFSWRNRIRILVQIQHKLDYKSQKSNVRCQLSLETMLLLTLKARLCTNFVVVEKLYKIWSLSSSVFPIRTGTETKVGTGCAYSNWLKSYSVITSKCMKKYLNSRLYTVSWRAAFAEDYNLLFVKYFQRRTAIYDTRSLV